MAILRKNIRYHNLDQARQTARDIWCVWTVMLHDVVCKLYFQKEAWTVLKVNEERFVY